VDQATRTADLSRSPVRLTALARLLWSRRLLIAVVVVVCAVLTALYAVTRKPVYQSVALLAPVKDENLQLGGAVSGLIGQVAGLAGMNLGGTSVNESVAVLQSRDFSLRFMREHGVDRYFFPRLWDEGKKEWKPRSRSGLLSFLARLGIPVEFDRGNPPPGAPADDLLLRFDDLRSAAIDRRTEFVKLSVKGPTPEIAQQWASAMISEVNDQLRAQALADSRRAVELLTKRVESDQLQSVHMAAASLLEAQLRREIGTESRAEFALKVLDPPNLPGERFYPRRSRMVMTGAALGFVLGALYVLTASWWRGRRPRNRVADGHD
jgi:uncharacterized protein involved in exopolysaccharide biosynthesis